MFDIKKDKRFIVFDNYKISVIADGYNYWFNTADITKALGYNDHRRAMDKHVNSQNIEQIKNLISTSKPDNHPNTKYVNEGKSGIRYCVQFCTKSVHNIILDLHF